MGLPLVARRIDAGLLYKVCRYNVVYHAYDTNKCMHKNPEHGFQLSALDGTP